MAVRKRRRKTAKKRASTALRVGTIVTRKLSPATLKKHGVRLKSVGKLDGKSAYKVVSANKRAKKTRNGLGSYTDAVERALLKQDQEHLMPLVRSSELEDMLAKGVTPHQASRVFILRWNSDQ